jgi:hypothetical protein
VYAEGPEEPSDIDRARARVLVRSGDAARGHLAGVLHGLDSVSFDAGPARHQRLYPDRVISVEHTPCVNGLQTLIDLAATLDDLSWEQALESALRKGLTTVSALEEALPRLGRARVRGAGSIRRVLALRPAGAPPTESLLETFMVQLARGVPDLDDPVRQYVVRDSHDQFVARVDLAWPDPGLFTELDGQQHKDQPVYDARRETAVVATTGWLPGRFTWTEVTRYPRSTARRLAALAQQAGRRRLGA